MKTWHYILIAVVLLYLWQQKKQEDGATPPPDAGVAQRVKDSLFRLFGLTGGAHLFPPAAPGASSGSPPMTAQGTTPPPPAAAPGTAAINMPSVSVRGGLLSDRRFG